MPKNPTKIREKIEALEAELKAAEREAREKKRQQIVRAAERSGLDKTDMTAADIERAFRALVREQPGDTPTQAEGHTATEAPRSRTEDQQESDAAHPDLNRDTSRDQWS